MGTPFGRLLLEWNKRVGKDKWEINLKRGGRWYSATGHWRTTFRKGGKGRGRNVFFGVYKSGGREYPFMHGAPPGWNVKPDGQKAQNITIKGKSKFRPPRLIKLAEHKAKIRKRLSRPGALPAARYNEAMKESRRKLDKAFEAVMAANPDAFKSYEFDGRQPVNFEEFGLSKPSAEWSLLPSDDVKREVMFEIYSKIAPSVYKAQKYTPSFEMIDKDLRAGNMQSKKIKAKYGVRVKTSKKQPSHSRDNMEALASRAMILLSEAMSSKGDNLKFPVIKLRYSNSRASLRVEKTNGEITGLAINARDRGSGYHEFTHWLEKTNSQVSDAGARFWLARTKGDAPTKLRQVGWPGYGEDEVTCPNKFVDPYVGRMYDDVTSTEVVTMGVDKFASEVRAFDLMRNDPEHFAFALAVVNGSFGKGVK